jgi:hypothetical protein
VKAFLEFVLANAKTIVEHPRVNYVSFADEMYVLGKKRLAEGKTGSAVADAPAGITDIVPLYRK